MCIGIFDKEKKLLAHTYPFTLEVGMHAFCMETQSSFVWDGSEWVDGGASLLMQGKQGPMGKTGEKGDKGDRGETGKNGKDGTNGRDGAAGKKGKDGKDGKDGERGDKGEKGDKGENGRDGKNGRDGSSIHSADEGPVEGIGVNNDLRINKKTGEIYVKSGQNRQFIHNLQQ